MISTVRQEKELLKRIKQTTRKYYEKSAFQLTLQDRIPTLNNFYTPKERAMRLWMEGELVSRFNYGRKRGRP
jgi:hypothetical protein